MVENQKFDQPILTPTTKADEGHDEDISREEIISSGLVSRITSYNVCYTKLLRKTIKFWDVKNERCFKTLPLPEEVTVFPVHFLSDNRFLVGVGKNIVEYQIEQ